MKLLNELQDLLADSLKKDVTHDDSDVMAELTLQVSSLYNYMCMYLYMYMYVDLISPKRQLNRYTHV